MKQLKNHSVFWAFAMAIMLSLAPIALCESSTTVTNQDAIIARVKAMGDSASADDVMREVSKMPGASEYDRIHLIEKINTGTARRTLLSLALRQRSDSSGRIAADAYVRVLPDKGSATNLLQSTDRMVLFSALLGLQDCKVDDDLWRQLKPLLESRDIEIRFRVFDVVNLNASRIPFTEDMLKAVVDSMRSIEHLPGATNIMPVSQIQFMSGLRNFETKASQAYAGYAGALAFTRNPKEALEKLTPVEAGNIRDAILIARAHKMDASLKPEMQRIFRESSLSGLRRRALIAFGNMATKDDLPFLRDIAANDSSYFQPYGELIAKLDIEGEAISTYKYYPFRKLAQRFVWKLAPTHSGRATPEEGGYPSLF